MKLIFGIFVVSFALIQQTVLGMEMNSNTCCKVSAESQTQYEQKLEQLMQACIHELGLVNKTKEEQRNGFFCVTECVGKKINVIDDNKHLNEEGLRNFVKTEMPLQLHHKDVAEQTILKCIKELKKPSQEINGCTNIILRADSCVEAELFKSCPNDMQDTSDECVKLRQRITSGQVS